MYDFHEVYRHINWLHAVKALTQVIIVCYMIVWVWKRIVGTQAERLVKGVLVLVAICALSYVLGFDLVTGFLQHLIPVAVMALLVIFQPEVRRGLGYLGKMNTFKLDLSLPNKSRENTKRDIAQIIAAVRELSRTRVGALIVVEPPEGERDYVSPGTAVNADISSTLLLTIFFPKSPLHDGAVVIRENKIIAAGVILPMTDNAKLSYRYGTRHRAAIGLSEIYDGLCIVVSEETGEISAAGGGMLRRYDSADELADPLAYIYSDTATDQEPGPVHSFLNLIAKKSQKPPASNGKAAATGSDVPSPSAAPVVSVVSPGSSMVSPVSELPVASIVQPGDTDGDRETVGQPALSALSLESEQAL